MDEFIKSVECYNYFVLGSDSSCNVYKSLREIQDDINVDYYGNPTPINQTSNISVEEGRSLVISPWDKNLIPEIEAHKI